MANILSLIFSPLRPYLAIGQGFIVLCALGLAGYFYWQYGKGQDAIATLKAEAAKSKLESQIANPIHVAEEVATIQAAKINTVYKTIYIEVEKHDNSNLDNHLLSSEWVRIYNTGARGVSEDTSSVALDDAATYSVSGTTALRAIVQGQEQYYELSNQLTQCQSYVKALEPYYDK